MKKKTLFILSLFWVISSVGLSTPDDREPIKEYVQRCKAGRRTILSENERLDAIARFLQNHHTWSSRQKQWVYEQFLDLRKRLKDGTETEVKLPPKGKPFDAKLHHMMKEDIDNTLSSFIQDGEIYFTTHTHRWISRLLSPIPGSTLELLRNATNRQELDQILTEYLRWRPTVSPSGRTAIFQSIHHGTPIRLRNVDSTEAILPLPEGMADQIAEAIRLGYPYTSPDAVAPEVFRATNENELVELLERNLNWDKVVNERSNVVTISDPGSNTKITFYGQKWGEEIRTYEISERKGFRNAVENHQHYITPEAQRKIEEAKNATPEELEKIVTAKDQTALRRIFQQDLIWEGEPDYKRRVIVFTDPNYGNTVTLELSSNRTFSEQDQPTLIQIQTAIKNHTNYPPPP